MKTSNRQEERSQQVGPGVKGHLSLKLPPVGYLGRWQKPLSEELLFLHLEILLFCVWFFLSVIGGFGVSVFTSWVNAETGW